MEILGFIWFIIELLYNTIAFGRIRNNFKNASNKKKPSQRIITFTSERGREQIN